MSEQIFNDQEISDLYNDASFDYSVSQIFSDAQSKNVSDTQSISSMNLTMFIKFNLIFFLKPIFRLIE
jgi:hypothetical protein